MPPRLFPRFLRVRLFKLPAAVVVSGLVRSTCLLSTFALSTLVVGHAMAQTPEAARVANTAAQSAELSPAQANAAQLVDAFVGALVAEQFDAARQFMTPGAVVVANGVVLGDRDGYIDGAAHKDAAALRTVQRDLLRREVSAGDDFAYVVSEKQMRVPGDASGRSERVIETVLMARTQAGWKITHIHWSGRHAG
jgi:ketosteroid isomerase-like protein